MGDSYLYSIHVTRALFYLYKRDVPEILFKCTCTSILELLKTSMFNDKQTGFYVVQSNHFYGNSADIFKNDGLHIHVKTLLQVFPRL